MLQERLGITTIIVTHDQREAMTMSDIVVVMSNATIEQVGPPLEIYRNPASAFVADFIGNSNLIEARVSGNRRVDIGGRGFDVGEIPEGLGEGAEVMVSIRPENVHVLRPGEHGPNRLEGEVTFVRDVGASVEVFIDCAGITVISISSPKDRPDVRQGETAVVELPAESCVVVRR